MIETILDVALFVLVALIIPCGYRAWQGPDVADRLLAIDLMTTLLVGIIVVIAVNDNASYLIDIAMAMAALSFIGTVSIARYIREQEVF